MKSSQTGACGERGQPSNAHDRGDLRFIGDEQARQTIECGKYPARLSLDFLPKIVGDDAESEKQIR